MIKRNNFDKKYYFLFWLTFNWTKFMGVLLIYPKFN